MKTENQELEDYSISKPRIKVAFILLSTFILIFVAVWIIFDWPSSVDGRFTLSKGKSLYYITAPSRGELAFLAEDKDTVCFKQPLAYIKGHGDYFSVKRLKDSLDSINGEYPDIIRDCYYGDLSSYVQNYLSAIDELGILNGSQKSDIGLNSNLENETKILERLTHLKGLQLQVEREVEILQDEECLDSILLIKGAVTRYEAEKSKLSVIQKRKELIEIKSEIVALEKSIEELRSESRMILATKDEDFQSAINQVRKSYGILKDAVEDWINRYVMVSPVEGMLENPMIVNDGSTVEMGSEVLRVLPSGDYIEGQAYFSSLNSYGITKGMSVKLLLDDYEENEYGFLAGTIKEISSSAVNTGEAMGYTCIISIDMANQPNFHAPLDFKHGMGGVVRFTVKQKSFWRRFLVWLKGKQNPV